MKVLALDLMVMLPDDFEGDLSDALRFFADYHTTAKHKAKNLVKGRFKGHYNKMTVEKKTKEIWKGLLRSFKEEGMRVNGGCSLSEYDIINEKWNHLTL